MDYILIFIFTIGVWVEVTHQVCVSTGEALFLTAAIVGAIFLFCAAVIFAFCNALLWIVDAVYWVDGKLAKVINKHTT